MIKKNRDRQIKEFGIGLGVILSIIGILPLLKKQPIHWWAIYTSLVVFLVRFSMPKLLSPVYAVFLKIAHIIGKVNSIILLGIMHYLIITPIGIIMKFSKNENFKKNIDKSLKSYWIARDPSLDSPERMERQF